MHVYIYIYIYRPESTPWGWRGWRSGARTSPCRSCTGCSSCGSTCLCICIYTYIYIYHVHTHRCYYVRRTTIMWCDDSGQLSNQVIVCWYAFIQIRSPDENDDWQQSHQIIDSTFRAWCSSGRYCWTSRSAAAPWRQNIARQKSTSQKSSWIFSGSFQWMFSCIFRQNVIVQWYVPLDYHFPGGFSLESSNGLSLAFSNGLSLLCVLVCNPTM